MVFEAPAGDPVGARRLTPRQVVTLLADVGRALESLHAQGAAHGAVAPERVLWDERATLALAGMPEVAGSPAEDARAALAVAAAALGAEGLAPGLTDALGAERARAIAETPVGRGADLIALADDLRIALVRARG